MRERVSRRIIALRKKLTVTRSIVECLSPRRDFECMSVLATAIRWDARATRSLYLEGLQNSRLRRQGEESQSPTNIHCSVETVDLE